MKSSNEWLKSIPQIETYILPGTFVISPYNLERLIISVQLDAIETAHKLAQQVIGNTFRSHDEPETDGLPSTAEEIEIDKAETKGDIEREERP